MKTLCTFLLLTLTTLTMTAQNSIPHTVDVTGEGVVRVVPDYVTIKVRVENTGQNAVQVKQENDRIVNEVLMFLKKNNVSEKDIQTEYIRLSKNFEYNTKTYNYAANNSIALKIKDLSKYESIMDGLIGTGINRVDGISFGSSDQDNLEREARKKAVANAKLKAQEYAGVLDQTIGKAISISEFGSSSPQPPMYKRAMMMDAESSGNQQTMAPGELEIQVKVQVSFLLF